MKNKILRLIKDAIPYVKELRPHTKSIASTVLMQQLDYWFTHYPEKFYKFMTKPDTPIDGYKDGDSWEEELGISVDEFRTAFDNIGVRYKSKTEYESAPDKFQGKFYCSYYDRLTRRTWYFRNHNLVDSVLDGLTAIKTKKQIRQEKSNLPEVDNPNFGKLATPISRSGQPQSLEVGDPNLYKLATPISNLYTEITTENTSEITTEKNKEADFVFSEIRDLKDKALDEENINSTANVKSIEDPIPPTPLSPSPEKNAKPLPPDPMGDRFRSKTNNRWQKVMSDRPEWQEILTEWASSKDCRLGFKESLLKAQIAHLKKWKLPDEVGDAMSSLSGYIKSNDLESFELRVDAAIAIEEADHRLEVMKITKPVIIESRWYLWQPMAKTKGVTIVWDRIPQTDNIPESEQLDRQEAVINKFFEKLQQKGCLHLAIANKHSIKEGSNVSQIFFNDEVVKDLGPCLQHLAQQLQGTIAA